MAIQHGAIGNGIIFCRHVLSAAGQIFTRFDRNAVISYTDMAIGNMHILAGLCINTICVGRRRVVNGNCIHRNVLTKFRVDRPER